MKASSSQFRPRLPKEAREKLRKGSAHKDKRRYDRKRDNDSLRQAKDFFK